jgi:hypothetical protein
MSNSLFQFLNQYRCKAGEKWSGQRTHYSIANPPGSYAVPKEQMMLFRTHYRETVMKRKVPTHLVEANQDCTPIKIDLDFHYESQTKKRMYHKKNIEQFIQLYMSVVEEYLISL